MKLKLFELDDYYMDEDGRESIYFSAPAELLLEKYPQSIGTELLIDIWPDYMEILISPTKYDEETDTYFDYDWKECTLLTNEEIQKLIKKAHKQIKINKEI